MVEQPIHITELPDKGNSVYVPSDVSIWHFNNGQWIETRSYEQGIVTSVDSNYECDWISAVVNVRLTNGQTTAAYAYELLAATEAQHPGGG